MPTTFGADANNNKIKVNVHERIEKYSKWWPEIKDFSGSKGPLWHTKTKATAELWLCEEGLQWDKIGKSPNQSHGEEKKKKKETKSRKREEIKNCGRKKRKGF